MNALNKSLIVSLLALLLLSTGLWWAGRDEGRGEFDRQMFRAGESEKIDHVTLQSSSLNIDLKFENSRWYVNQKWEADQQMIKVLFAMLRQVEPRRPVSAGMRDSLRNALINSGVKVTLSSSGVDLMTFYAGGNAAKSEAYFVKEGEGQPYVVIIPGYRVYVSGVLELDEGGWRNKRVFDFNWRNFRSLKASYPKEPQQGFEVEMKDHYFGIKGMTADTTKLNNYLDAVSLLFASRYVPKGPVSDSLAGREVGARIEILDIGDRSYSLDIFAPGKEDQEIFGRKADGEVVAFEKRSLSEILRRRTWFVAR